MQHPCIVKMQNFEPLQIRKRCSYFSVNVKTATVKVTVGVYSPASLVGALCMIHRQGVW